MSDSKPLPNFIIGGAPRAGTTWLRAALDEHPDIYMARPPRPEPKFFLLDDLYRRGLCYYSHQWFANAPSDSIKGEKSTNYLESPTAAERIRTSLPNVKLIFSLREPAERAYSNYLWSTANGLEREDFATALKLEPIREHSCPAEARASRPHAYLARGMYADLLQPYFYRFDARQILCIRFEDFVTSPTHAIKEVHRFLGATERPDSATHVPALNVTRAEHSQIPDEVIALKEYFREANHRLQDLLGPDFEIWQ